MGRPDKTKHITKWLRVQDQRKPRRVAPMCLLSSLRGKSKSSKKPSVSWTPIRTVPCPVNFTQMVMLFAEKMAGGADDDDTILKAFEAFEVADGYINAEQLKGLMVSKKEDEAE